MNKDLHNVGADELSRECATNVGIDWAGSGIESCIDDGEGLELLKKSVQHTADIGVRWDYFVSAQEAFSLMSSFLVPLGIAALY